MPLVFLYPFYGPFSGLSAVRARSCGSGTKSLVARVENVKNAKRTKEPSKKQKKPSRGRFLPSTTQPRGQPADNAGMSLPRMSIPGGTYLVTRTTVMSMFLLAPDRVVNEIMEYCLAWAAREHGILIHAVIVQANHYHAVVTDPEGKLSEFVQELNRCAARCLLAYYRSRFPHRRVEALWASSQPFSATLLVNANAVLDEIV